MGSPDSKLYSFDQVELAKTMAYQHLGGDVIAGLGLDRKLFEQKLHNYIRPHLSDLRGFEPLENLSQSGVETLHIWKDAMDNTSHWETRCVRLTSHGIQMYRKGKPVFTVLVFMTRKLQFITAISEKREGSDWQWPRDFVYHSTWEDLLAWSDQLIQDEGLNSLNMNEDSFTIKVAQLLDDLLRQTVRRRRESLQRLEKAEHDARIQNVRFTGYEYLTGDVEYAIREGLAE